MIIIYILTALLATSLASGARYDPTWESVDSRPLPHWYDDVKFGIFIHWGVFSVPSFGTEWFWEQWKSNSSAFVKFMKDQYPPQFTYQDFAKDFDAYFYDPDWWADLIKDSGAKYVVLTTKHHEGYTLWPSNVSFSWNAKDVGPNRDLVGDLANSIRKRTDVHFGVYHSMFEWFNPLYLQDRANQFQTKHFVDFKTMPELHELVNTYKPDLIWSDGDWEAPYNYWNSTGFLAWLYNDSPVKDSIVVNDRWGAATPCHHGGYYTCQDKYNPGHLVEHKWENAYTLDKNSWGYRREGVLADYLTDLEFITVMAETVSCGGNLLMNIGPRKDGRIDPLMEERLRNIGKWMRINGEAIYGTKPWIFQNETKTQVWYTGKQTQEDVVDVYAIVLKWPDDGKLRLEKVKPTQGTKVSMLGFNRSDLKFARIPSTNDDDTGMGIIVDLNPIRFNDIPSTVAWVLKLEHLAMGQQRFHPTVLKNYIFQ